MSVRSRRRRIRDRAAALHEQLTWLLPRLTSLSFEAFVAANRRPGIVDEAIKPSEKLYVFHERARGSNFRFFVSYAHSDSPELSAYGLDDYLGVIIVARSIESISINWNVSLPPTPYGRDASWLYQELSKLPHCKAGFIEVTGSRTGVPTADSVMFLSRESADFQDIRKWHPSQMSTMPIVAFRDDGSVGLIGTCFAINPSGIAITARHVLDEALGIRSDEEYSSLGPECLEHVGVFFWTNIIDVEKNRPYGDFLAIGWFSADPRLDIAIIKLVLPLDDKTRMEVPVRAVTLSPGIPEPGTACVGFGYPRMDGKRDENLRLVLEQDFKSTAGVIEEIHFPQRDSRTMRFPCFRTTARFDGGMSGGPIISKDGQVCGVICSGFETDDVEAGYISYGSLIGPILGCRVLVAGRDQTPVQMLVNDLVTDGSIDVDDTYKGLRVIKQADLQIIDFGQERFWFFGLASKGFRLQLRERLYRLRYGNQLKDWYVEAGLFAAAAIAGLASLLLGCSLEDAGKTALATGIVLAGALMIVLEFLL